VTEKNHSQLVAELDARSQRRIGSIYRIDGIGDRIAYNPSRPFQCIAPVTGREVTAMYVRVESVEADWFNHLERPPGVYDSEAILYLEDEPGHWTPATPENFGPAGLQHDLMEDPFCEFIDNELVFGGVRIDFSTAEGGHDPVPLGAIEHFHYPATPTVTTEFFRGRGPGDLRRFATIRHMRDVRVLRLSDGRILVATRPQGGEAGLGSIGLVVLDSLAELDQSAAERAVLVKGLLAREMKIGANELYLLPKGNGRLNDEVGILAHTAAREDSGHVSYFAAAFRILNPYSFAEEGIEHTPVTPIARRSDWPPGKVKREMVEDVVFPAALIDREDEIFLVVGLSDGEIGELSVPDPFVG
jgi:Protein of unknown function (DUF1861)